MDFWRSSRSDYQHNQRRQRPFQRLKAERISARYFARKAVFESLEMRNMLSSVPSFGDFGWAEALPGSAGVGEGEAADTDVVRYSLALTDTLNQPLPTDVGGHAVVGVGQTFRLIGTSQDVRSPDAPAGTPAQGEPLGVFASYMDVFYTNADLIMVRHGETQLLRFVPVAPPPDQTAPPAMTGEFVLDFEGRTTAPIVFDSNPGGTALAIQQALENLPNVRPGNVRVSVDSGDVFAPDTSTYFRILFLDKLGERDVPTITVDASQLGNCEEASVTELFPADLSNHWTFRGSFTPVSPFVSAFQAVNKTELEPGQPAGGAVHSVPSVAL
jgi:hypothetical protein